MKTCDIAASTPKVIVKIHNEIHTSIELSEIEI